MKEQGWLRMEKIGTDYKTRSGHNYSLRPPLANSCFFFFPNSLCPPPLHPLYTPATQAITTNTLRLFKQSFICSKICLEECKTQRKVTEVSMRL